MTCRARNCWWSSAGLSLFSVILITALPLRGSWSKTARKGPLSLEYSVNRELDWCLHAAQLPALNQNTCLWFAKTVTPWSIISQIFQCEPLQQWNSDLWDNDSKIIISVKHWKTEPLSNYLIFCCYHNQVNCPKGSIFKTWNLSHPWTMCSPSPAQWDRTIQPIPLKKELSAFCSKSHYTHFCSEDGKYCLQKRIFLTYNHSVKKKTPTNQFEWWKIKAFGELKHQPYQAFDTQTSPGWKGPRCHWLWNMDDFKKPKCYK